MKHLNLALLLAAPVLLAGLPAGAASDPLAPLKAIRTNSAALHSAAQTARAHGDAGTAAVAEYLAYLRDPNGSRTRFIASVGPNGDVSVAYMHALDDGLLKSNLAPYAALVALAHSGDAAARTRLAFVKAHSDGEVGEFLADAGAPTSAAPASDALNARPAGSPFRSTTVGALLRSTSALKMSPAPTVNGDVPAAGEVQVTAVRSPDVQGIVALKDVPPSARLSDGTWISLWELSLGGSGGSFGAVVFAWHNGAPHYAGSISAPNGGLMPAISGSMIVARSSGVQSDNGAAPTIITRYRIADGALLKL